MDLNTLVSLVVGGGLMVGTVVFIVWLVRSGGRIEKEWARRKAAARPGRARILEASGSPVTGGDSYDPEVRFVFQVTPTTGATYTVKTSWNVAPIGIPRVQPGLDIDVLIDAVDPNVLFPTEPWAEFDSTAALKAKMRAALAARAAAQKG